ncbi:MAG: DNA gyrase subunit A [Lachnospiraceae bacterium]|nr:DNA gyrase subunit A [Lachnospiraceae bacterium]
MDEHVFDKIQHVDLKETMETSYIDYAMSVIVARALPDVRDGLKPVQRRVLYSMIELNNTPDKPHRKCARIVGDTMGKFHPHGDSSIYGALVNLAQEWSTRYPLVDGHGNFGSVDGDGAAAMRYTEARLSKISMEMLADINKNTVDFSPNFDETETEPDVLPARIPNLLVNGTSGIAVGMATNIPPHNLGEVIDAVIKMIDNYVQEDRETSIGELMKIVKGPDFPTGGIILGRRGIEQAYRTGRGKIRVRAVVDTEPMENGKTRIVVSELPFMVNKAKLIEKIADLVKEKRIDGIVGLRDESDKQGMRVVIELRRDVNANVILNQLYKHTQLQDSFGVNMLALVNNEPKVLNLYEMLYYYLQHQKDVVTRRTQYELNRAEERAHILEGLLKALDHIDEVISIIRSSKTTAEAKARLIERFEFSDVQAQNIVDMRLRQLTGLAREELLSEYQELEEKIAELKAILADEKLLLGVIREEIGIVKEKYADERRTQIGIDDAEEFTSEDLIPDEDVVVTMTNLGYIKRTPADTFKNQGRGGRGIRGMQTIEDDFVKEMFAATTHQSLMLFTNRGRVFRLKVYEIPEASRTARGTAIVNLLQLMPDEKISAVIPTQRTKKRNDAGEDEEEIISAYTDDEEADDFAESGAFVDDSRDEATDAFDADDGDSKDDGEISDGENTEDAEDGDAVDGSNPEDHMYLVMATKRGLIKRTKLSAFSRIQKNGLIAIVLREDDDLIEVKVTNGKNDIFLVTGKGQCIRFHESCVRPSGRVSMGVKGIRLMEGDEVVAMQTNRQGKYLLFVTEKGMGKRTKLSEFPRKGRAGKGVIGYKIKEKTGDVVSAKAVFDDDEVMLITSEGILIRISASSISVNGRAASGVKLMTVDKESNAYVSSVARIREDGEPQFTDEV